MYRKADAGHPEDRDELHHDLHGSTFEHPGDEPTFRSVRVPFGADTAPSVSPFIARADSGDTLPPGADASRSVAAGYPLHHAISAPAHLGSEYGQTDDYGYFPGFDHLRKGDLVTSKSLHTPNDISESWPHHSDIQFNWGAHKAAEENSQGAEVEEFHAPALPPYFRVERSNFALCNETAELRQVCDVMHEALQLAKVDVLKFKPGKCKWTCSYFVGNQYMEMRCRLFAHKKHFLAELQRREGDCLYFRRVFDAVLRMFMGREELRVQGSYHYPRGDSELQLRPCTPPGEAERHREISKSAGVPIPHGSPPPPARDSFNDQSPAFRIEDSDDETVLEDLKDLVAMARSKFMDTQAEASQSLAGLTAAAGFCKLLRKHEEELQCTPCLRVLLRSSWQPSRRYAVVAIANITECKGFAKWWADGRGGDDTFCDLVELLCTETTEIGVRRECGRALKNLLAAPELKQSLQHCRTALSHLTQLRSDHIKDDTLQDRIEACKVAAKEAL